MSSPAVGATCSCGASFEGPHEQVALLVKDHSCTTVLGHAVMLVTVLVIAVTGLIMWFTVPDSVWG